MSKGLLRIVSIVVLITAVLMLTGQVASISAAAFEKVEKASCDGSDDHEQHETVPCSAPDCPMFLCLSFYTVEPSIPEADSTETVATDQFTSNLILKPFVKLIFHPPSIA